MGLEVPSSYCALKKALYLGFLNLKGTSIVSRNVSWMSTRDVYVWWSQDRNLPGGNECRMVSSAVWNACVSSSVWSLWGQRPYGCGAEDGRVSMSELRSGVWTGPRKYPVRTAEALAQHRATRLPRAGMLVWKTQRWWRVRRHSAGGFESRLFSTS